MFLKTSSKELFSFLLFGHFFALFTMNAGSLVDKGCSEEFERVSVTISGTDIKCGDKYSLSLVGNSEQPEFSLPSADEGSMYTVTMIDPDAPSSKEPVNRSWLHFMAVNVEGKDLKAGGNIPGDTFVKGYNPPTPPQGSGFHRYTIFALKQSEKLQGISFAARSKFNIDKFVQDNSLEVVGSNMFKTETK